ncbi:MAG: hypothetical protein J6N15_00145 [Ruminiclostridium sp.]|nr:hypothetical protein [Ruminiclostridium sp.]
MWKDETWKKISIGLFVVLLVSYGTITVLSIRLGQDRRELERIELARRDAEGAARGLAEAVAECARIAGDIDRCLDSRAGTLAELKRNVAEARGLFEEMASRLNSAGGGTASGDNDNLRGDESREKITGG